MKTYLLDVINRIKRFSEKFDVTTTLCDKTWLVFNDTGEKEVYIFQANGTVFITTNGVGIKGHWQWVSANQSLIINKDDIVMMFHPEFIDNTVLALTLDGTNEMAFLIEQGSKDTFVAKTLAQLENYFVDKEQKLIQAEKDRIERERLQAIEDERKRREKEKKQKEKEERDRKEIEIEQLKEEAKKISEELKPKWFETLSSITLLISLSIGIVLGFIYAAKPVWDFLANEPKPEPTGLFDKIVEPIFFFIIQIGLPLIAWFALTFGVMGFFFFVFVMPLEPLAKKKFNSNLEKWHERNPTDKRYPFIEFDSTEKKQK